MAVNRFSKWLKFVRDIYDISVGVDLANEHESWQPATASVDQPDCYYVNLFVITTIYNN